MVLSSQKNPGGSVKNKGLFTIGQFSRLAQVTARTLRFYQEQGLLEPRAVEEKSGVRYYSGSQIAEVNLILSLKGTGMSLDAIRSVLPLKKSSSDALLERLKEQALTLEREIQSKTGSLGTLQAVISAMESGDEKRAGYLESIRTVRRSPRSIYSMRRNCRDEKEIMDFFREFRVILQDWLDKENIPRVIPMAWSLSPSLEEEQDMELAVYSPELGPHLHSKTPPKGAAEAYLPGGQFAMLSVEHSSEFRQAYNALGEWAASQGLKTGSPLSEEYQDLDWVQGGETKMILWMPVA
jgi:DNA-binding transcriptional MerR regulator